MKLSYFAIIITLLILISCSTNNSISGTAESGNAKVAGIIIDTSGFPEENIIVNLLPVDFNPVITQIIPDSLKDTTDINGKYNFSINDSGEYNIYINDSKTQKGLLIRQLNLVPYDSISREDTLKATERLLVTSPSNSTIDSSFIFIPGTLEYHKITKGINSIEFASLPLGLMPPVLVVEENNLNNTTTFIEDNQIEIIADTTITFGILAEWKYNKTIKINTTTTGGNTDSDLYHFPLLIELNNQNFEFTNVNNDGSDIRFIRSDSIILKYEIESWNTASKQALIWVNVDTIYGNNNDQFIKILWGNNLASSNSIAGEVFDTAKGYSAVWHFGENNTFKDVTYHSNNGTNNGTINQNSSIGNGIYLDGGIDDNYIEVTPSSSLRPSSAVTLQAWINPDSVNTSQIESFFSYTVDDSSTESGFSFGYAFGNWKFLIITENMSKNDVNDNPGADVPIDTWSLITGTYDGNTIKVYLNGELVSSENKTGNIDWDPAPAFCRIGMYKDSNEAYEFNGGIDELRVMNKACSDDWIKLCYENQKENSTVLSFE